MADKKITALTELTSTGKVSSTDLLHIIDYSASPVNKKITVSNLLKDANTAITSFGAFTHDLGPTNAISGLSVVVPNATPAASAETEVVVNDDGNAFVDFRVQTSLNDKAFHIDSSLDDTAGNCNTITINGGAIAGTKKVDFKVNSSTGILVHCDSTDHVVGFGTAAPDTAYIADFAAVSGKSIKTAGSVDITGAITATTTAAFTGSTSVGATASGTLNLLSVESITAASATAVNCSNTHTTTLLTTNHNDGNGALADGTTVGQIKIISCVVRGGSGNDYVLTPANFKNGSTITFDAVGDCVTLIWQTGGWAVAGGFGIAIA